MKSLLSNFLRQTNPILLLLKAVDSKKEGGFDDMINKGIYDLEARNAVDNADFRFIYSPIYCKADFNNSEDKYIVNKLDSSEFWINYKLLEEFQSYSIRKNLIISTVCQHGAFVLFNKII